MHTRRGYHQRSIKRARLQKRLALAAMFALAACAAWVLQPGPEQPAPTAYAAAAPVAQVQTAPPVQRIAKAPAPARQRRVYPYSIVPGGVTSRAELAQAVMADKVVAAHYAGFAVQNASLRSVAGVRAVYVSYRKDGQVYWTAHKVRLADGESILSDGSNEIRARCGNRISETPRLPVEAKGPDEHELDTPLALAEDAGDGVLLPTAYTQEENDAGSQVMAQAFSADGAGPPAADLVRAGAARASASSLLDAGIQRPLIAGLGTTVSRLDHRTATGNPAGSSTVGSAPASPGTMDSNATETGGASTGGVADSGGAGAGGTGDATGTGTSTGTGTGTSTGTGTGAGPETGKPAVPGTRTGTGPSTGTGADPAKPYDLPEPGTLWLTGVAAAALLLHRRRSRPPR